MLEVVYTYEACEIRGNLPSQSSLYLTYQVLTVLKSKTQIAPSQIISVLVLLIHVCPLHFDFYIRF